jgi:hypothetical protein
MPQLSEPQSTLDHLAFGSLILIGELFVLVENELQSEQPSIMYGPIVLTFNPIYGWF